MAFAWPDGRQPCWPTKRVPSATPHPVPAFQQQAENTQAWERHVFEERMRRAPDILVRLRSHTVWERTSVKLCFTVQGFPTPVVQW